MKKKTVAFSKDSSNLFFHILTKCNLSCKHCYINPEQHGTTTLDIDTIKEWLNLFSEKCNNINVIFLGGEPTLHPDLSLAVKEAGRLGFKSITIDTNGYLFHDILKKIRPDEVDFISFSLDGATKKTNDSIRGNGSYDTVLSGIKKAVDAGFSASMIYTVSADNLHELPLMPDLINGLGIERFFIQVIGIRGTSATERGSSCITDEGRETQLPIAKNFSFDASMSRSVMQLSQETNSDDVSYPTNRQVSMKSWIETVPDVARKVAQLGITVTYPKVFLENEELFECAGIVADNYFIFPNGRIYRCPLCEDYPLHSLEIKVQTPCFCDGPDEEKSRTKKTCHNRVFDPKRTKSIISTPKINESNLFELNIPEGCVMNKLIQPGNLVYNVNKTPCYKIACCMLKEEISPED